MTTPLPSIRHGAAPFLLDGGAVGAVCVHGFTASPEEMRWMAEYLNAQGMTVFVPRLAGHGTTPDMMRRQHWLDWYESVLDGLALVRARCDAAYAVGLSMGGLLSLRAAAEGLVDGLAVLASPLYVNNPLMPFAGMLKYVRPYYTPDITDNLDERVREAQREMGREDYGRVSYDERNPTAAVAQLHALMGEVRAHLAQVTAPLLLVYSKGDRTVPYDNMQQVADGVRSADLVQHTLEHSDHVLTQDDERDTVFALVWDFIRARAGA